MPIFGFNEKVNRVLKLFIKKYQSDPNTVAIILTGSYAHSTPSINSDLDVFIILNESEWRERGNIFIEGYEIEYFLNPIKQVYKYLKNEENDIRPVTAHMLTHCNVVYTNPFHNENKLGKILEYARKIYYSDPPELTFDDIEVLKYYYDDGMKDLEDAMDENNILSFHLVATDIVDKAIDSLYKIKRVKKAKPKRMNEQLSKIDSKFYDKLISVFQEQYSFQSVYTLVSYVESLIGGKREKTWKLRSACTYNSQNNE